MSELEKRAWWNLCVVVGAVVLFAALWIVTRNYAGSEAGFSVLGLSGCPFFRLRQPARDERDLEIDRKSMVAAMRVFWILLVIGSVGMGAVLGWDTLVQVPAWAISEPMWYGGIVILAVRSAVSIRMYRAG